MISFLFRFVFIYLTYARATAETFPWGQLTTTGTNPSARVDHSSVVSNGKMVVFGGDDGSRKNDAWTLDLNAPLGSASTRPTYSFVPAFLVCVVAIFA